MTETAKNIVVLYHDACADGFTSAWCANRYFSTQENVDVTYIPVKYHEPMPEEALAADHLYILDFSYKLPVLQEWLDATPEWQKLTILDHHASAEKELAPLLNQDVQEGVEVVFDMDRSGAAITRDYFFKAKAASKMPLVDYVQDRDLWAWELPDSQEVSMVIASTPFSFDNWDELNERVRLKRPLAALVKDGSAMATYRDDLVQHIAKNHYTARIGADNETCGYLVPCVNSPMLQSEIGNYLCKEQPFACIYFVKPDGTCGVSLRSDKDDPEAIDVGALAAKFGGGGHKNAAGFELPSPPIEGSAWVVARYGLEGSAWAVARYDHEHMVSSTIGPPKSPTWREFFRSLWNSFTGKRNDR